MSELSGNETIYVRCGACDKKLKVPAAAAGRRVKCPNCGEVVAVPGSSDIGKPNSTAGKPAAATGESIRTACASCGAKIKVPANAAGKRVKCPKCASIITIETPAAPPETDDFGFSDDDDGLLDELAAVEKTSAAVEQPNFRDLAPAPGLSATAANASPGGGFSMRDAAGVAGGAVVGAGKFFGPLALGSLLAAVAAVIGGVIWTLVAMYTQREFGLLAWGLGALVGLGMALGLRRESVLGGVIAAVLSLISIVGAKYTIFVLVLVSVFSAMAGNESSSISPLQQEAEEEARLWALQSKRNDLALDMVDTILDEWGDHIEADRKRDWYPALDEARIRIGKLSEEEVYTRWDELQAEQEREYAAMMEEIESESDQSPETLADQTVAPAEMLVTEDADEELEIDEESEYYDEEYDDEEWTEEEAAQALGAAFGSAMFGFKDLIFIPLALLSAFRIGYRGPARE